jgi:hypothetical protein
MITVVRDSTSMFHWLYVVLHLLNDAIGARRDARVRFLKAQIHILRCGFRKF